MTQRLYTPPFKKIAFLFSLLLCLHLLSTSSLQAQISPIQENAARAELQKRGLSEDEVRAKMLQRGIDIDNVRPEQLPTLQPILEEVLAELEAEKAAQGATQSAAAIDQVSDQLKEGIDATIKEELQEEASQISEEVQESVAEGASLEEAISETLVDESQAALPPASIYGHDIFRNQSLKLYRTTKDVKPPDSYVLGVGDEIAISIFGVSQADLAFEINEDGYITPGGLPRIYLKGITYGQAKTLVRNRFSQYYVFEPGQFAMSIKAARTITVNIFGEVENYGSFTISAINTAFNALVAAGGPTNIGTMRNISIIRNGKTRKMDVYQFLFDPTVQYDFFLENNDIIHVPTADRIVSIAGEVKRPMRYELIGNEHLLKLIEYAGGLTDRAYAQNVQIRRIQGNNTILIDVNLSELISSGQDFNLHSSDQVSIRPIPGRYENFATIKGAVELPGQYEITNNMRVSDLLAKGSLQPEARTDIAFLLRTNRDGTVRLLKLNLDSLSNEANIALMPKDELMVYAKSRFIDRYKIAIGGAVRQPTEHPFDPTETITVADMVLLAGGMEAGASRYAYIRRPDVTNPKLREYLKIDIEQAVTDPSSTDNQILKPGDQITVYSRSRFTDDADIAINGAVRDPGEYAYDESLRVSDVIYLSGGLTNDATDFGYIIRADSTNRLLKEYIRVDVASALANPGNADDLVLAPFDRFQVLAKSTFTEVSSVQVTGSVRNPGEYQFDSSLSVRDVLTLAGGLKLEASYSRIDVSRVIINQDQPTRTVVATLQVDEDYNVIGNPGFTLQPFDLIVVRRVPDFKFQETVTINGEVQYPGLYAITTDKEKLNSLLQRSGGLTLEAFPEGALLYRPDDNTGFIVTKLDKVIKNPSTRFNYMLKAGDVITIPKSKELVSIRLGNTLASELYPDKMLTGGKINVAKKGAKRAGWYIRKYAAGYSKNAKRNRVTVEHPNGEIRRTTELLGLNIQPILKDGSTINIGSKPPPKPEKEKRERQKGDPIDWDRAINNALALATSALTIIVLADRL